MVSQEMVAAGCIEMALEAKMTDCMAQAHYWRQFKPVLPGDEERREGSMLYWQDRLRNYFFAAVLACDAGVTVRTPEQMMKTAALNFLWIRGAKGDA